MENLNNSNFVEPDPIFRRIIDYREPNMIYVLTNSKSNESRCFTKPELLKSFLHEWLINQLHKDYNSYYSSNNNLPDFVQDQVDDLFDRVLVNGDQFHRIHIGFVEVNWGYSIAVERCIVNSMTV